MPPDFIIPAHLWSLKMECILLRLIAISILPDISYNQNNSPILYPPQVIGHPEIRNRQRKRVEYAAPRFHQPFVLCHFSGCVGMNSKEIGTSSLIILAPCLWRMLFQLLSIDSYIPTQYSCSGGKSKIKDRLDYSIFFIMQHVS